MTPAKDEIEVTIIARRPGCVLAATDDQRRVLIPERVIGETGRRVRVIVHLDRAYDEVGYLMASRHAFHLRHLTVGESVEMTVTSVVGWGVNGFVHDGLPALLHIQDLERSGRDPEDITPDDVLPVIVTKATHPHLMVALDQ